MENTLLKKNERMLNANVLETEIYSEKMIEKSKHASEETCIGKNEKTQRNNIQKTRNVKNR